MTNDLGYLAAELDITLRLIRIADALAARLTTATSTPWRAESERKADRISITVDSGLYRAVISGSVALVYSGQSDADIAAILAPHVLALQPAGVG